MIATSLFENGRYLALLVISIIVVELLSSCTYKRLCSVEPTSRNEYHDNTAEQILSLGYVCLGHTQVRYVPPT